MKSCAPGFSQTSIHHNSHRFICHAVPFWRTFPQRGIHFGPCPLRRENDQLGYCQFNVAWIWGFKEMDSWPERSSKSETFSVTESPFSHLQAHVHQLQIHRREWTFDLLSIPKWWPLKSEGQGVCLGREHFIKPEFTKRKLFYISDIPRHFSALTDLRFCLCHLCFMFRFLYPVPSHPVSSRNGSVTPRICPSSLFSTLMCCYWCLLQTDTGHASEICSTHNLLYMRETAVCCTEIDFRRIFAL